MSLLRVREYSYSLCAASDICRLYLCFSLRYDTAMIRSIAAAMAMATVVRLPEAEWLWADSGSMAELMFSQLAMRSAFSVLRMESLRAVISFISMSAFSCIFFA